MPDTYEMCAYYRCSQKFLRSDMRMDVEQFVNLGGAAGTGQ